MRQNFDYPAQVRNLVSFQALTFNFSVSRTTPIEILRGEEHIHFKKLVAFLCNLEDKKLLDEDTVTGKIFYADDQYVNQQSIKRHCEDLEISSQLTLFNDGQDVIDRL